MLYLYYIKKSVKLLVKSNKAATRDLYMFIRISCYLRKTDAILIVPAKSSDLESRGLRHYHFCPRTVRVINPY